MEVKKLFEKVVNNEVKATPKKESKTSEKKESEKRSFWAKTTFKIIGQNVAGFLNEVFKQNVRIFDVKKQENELYFAVYSQDKQKIIDLSDNLYYNYSIVKERGFKRYVLKLLSRRGIAAGFVVVFVFLLVASMFLSNIKINLPALEYEVQAVLEKHGAKQGAYIGHIDTETIEAELLSLPGVSLASVRLKGTTLVINLKTELDPPSFEPIKSETYVTATKKATVSRVIVYDGTALVKTGDIVEAGSQLIAPYTVFGDTHVQSFASGEVYGKTYYTYETVYSGAYVQKTYGEERTYSSLMLFGKQGKLPESPFEVYEKTTSTSVLGFIFPLHVTAVTYKEVVYSVVEMPFSEAENRVKSEALEKARAKMSASASFVAEWCNVTMDASGNYRIQAIVECEELLS